MASAARKYLRYNWLEQQARKYGKIGLARGNGSRVARAAKLEVTAHVRGAEGFGDIETFSEFD